MCALPVLREQMFEAVSVPPQVTTSVLRDSFVEKTRSVKTGIPKRNVSAGAATPPSTGTPPTAKVGLLSWRHSVTGRRF